MLDSPVKNGALSLDIELTDDSGRRASRTAKRLESYSEAFLEAQEEQRMRFSDALGYYMGKFGKNQRDIAKHMGVSEATVSHWVGGVKMPRPHRVQALADYFGVHYRDMLAIPAHEDFAGLDTPSSGIVDEVDSLLNKIEKATPLVYGGTEVSEQMTEVLKTMLIQIQKGEK